MVSAVLPVTAAPCPLCGKADTRHYHSDRQRDYLQCQRCRLVFVPPPYHLSAALEKAEYDKHRNTIDDAGYRKFLNRLAQPLIARLPAHSRGLDFGCGPGPALAEMLRSAGFEICLYDPYYYPDSSVLNARYDFITATEVFEHLAQPGRELARLWGLLKPGGTLGLMTKLVIDRRRFANWHYIRDPTHVVFFSRDTLDRVARHLNAGIDYIGSDVIVLRKS